MDIRSLNPAKCSHTNLSLTCASTCPSVHARVIIETTNAIFSYIWYFPPLWLLFVLNINFLVLTTAHVRRLTLPTTGPPGLSLSSTMLPTHLTLRAPLPTSPVLDCNRRHNYHICTRSYIVRQIQADYGCEQYWTQGAASSFPQNDEHDYLLPSLDLLSFQSFSQLLPFPSQTPTIYKLYRIPFAFAQELIVTRVPRHMYIVHGERIGEPLLLSNTSYPICFRTNTSHIFSWL